MRSTNVNWHPRKILSLTFSVSFGYYFRKPKGAKEVMNCEASIIFFKAFFNKRAGVLQSLKHRVAEEQLIGKEVTELATGVFNFSESWYT